MTKSKSLIRMVSVSLLFLMLFSLLALPAFAAPTSYFLNVPVVGQSPKQNWCWIACGTSVTRYCGYNISKDDFSIAAVGNATHDSPGTMANVQTGLQNWNISSTYVNSTVSYATLKNQIYGGHPYLAGRMYAYFDASTGSIISLWGHMFVICGYNTDYTGDQFIEVMDPAGSGAKTLFLYSIFYENTDATTSVYSFWNESLKID